MDFYAAKQMVDDWCSCGWVSDTEIRALTADEHQAAKMRRQTHQEMFPGAEVIGLRYERPRDSKYRAPREAYDDTELPLVGHTCAWRQRLLRELTRKEDIPAAHQLCAPISSRTLRHRPRVRPIVPTYQTS